MFETTSDLVRLDAYQNDNWVSREIPVAILNMESTLHDRIAYAWGLANQLHVLSGFLGQHENPEIQQIAALFRCQLTPLEALLHNLGDDTKSVS